MEPMTLGSPPSSPSTSPVNPNFLPAFLMGENQTSSPRTTSISPSKNRNVAFKPSTPISDPNRSRFFAQSPQESTFNMSAVNEKSGPPSRGLFDTIDGGKTDFVSPVKEYTSPAHQKNLNESLNRSYRRNIVDNEPMWVTVLGFPPHAANLVLSQFSQCGNIIEKKFPPEGNWVHIKYSSPYETAKALSFNGKLISNSIMIGVIPYSFSENKENTAMNNSINESVIITSPNRARPLTQSFISQPHSTDVLSPENVPQKSTGIVTKAMEYVFGW